MVYWIDKKSSLLDVEIFLIHGLGGSSELWFDFLDILGVSKICLIDLPGHGGASLRPISDISEVYEPLADFFSAFSGKKKAVIGHSLGGFILLNLLSEHPDFFEKAVLLSTDYRIFPHPNLMQQISTKKYDRAFLKEGFPDEVSEKVIDAVVRSFEWMDILSPSPENFLGLNKWKNVNFQSIKIPCLFIAGKEDKVISPRRTRYLSKSILSSQFVQIEGAGHYAFLEKPEATARAIQLFFRED